MKTLVAILVAAACLLLPIRAPAQTTVPWYATSMGFEASSSSTTIMKSVVGQAFAGTLQAGNTIIESGFLADTLFRTVVTSVAEQGGVPKEYALRQNYPNPFNPSTTIRFELPHASRVSLTLYNVLGQELLTLVDQDKPAGIYDVQFGASKMSSGVYFYRLHARPVDSAIGRDSKSGAGDFVSTKRMLLVR